MGEGATCDHSTNFPKTGVISYLLDPPPRYPPKEPCVVSGVGQQLDTYPGQVRGVSYPVHHLLTLWMDGCYVGPHPLPGDALNGETSTVDVEQNSSVLLLLLPWGAGAVIQG